MSTQSDNFVHTESKAKHDGFQQWLAKPETKYFMSKIPQSEDPDLVRTVLDFAFRAGFDFGVGHIASTMTKVIFEGMQNKNKKDGEG